MSIKEVLVPDIGNFKDVEVIEMMVNVGDEVAADASLMTVESDKAAMDIPAPFAGTVKEIKIKVGDKVSEGSLVLMMDTSAVSAPAAAGKTILGSIHLSQPPVFGTSTDPSSGPSTDPARNSIFPPTLPELARA